MFSIEYDGAVYNEKPSRCSICNGQLKFASQFRMIAHGSIIGTLHYGETCLKNKGMKNDDTVFDQNKIRAKYLLELEAEGGEHPTIDNKNVFRDQYPEVARFLDTVIETQTEKSFVTSVAFQYGRNGTLSERQIECISKNLNSGVA